jgi:hypothetical protein
MKRYSAIIVIVVASLVMLGMLGCSVGRRIVKGANTPTSTPTATRRPTFTATVTATLSPLVTNTPMPSPTPQVPPTNTPVPVTDTPQPEPPTNTPKPAPPPPPPTDTPVPQPAEPPPTPTPSTPYVGRIVSGFPNCGSTGLFGHIKDTGGGIVADINVHVWTDNWEGFWAKSKGETFGNDGDRNFELPIDLSVVGGSWHVAITEGENMELRSPIYEMTTTQHCEGDGAVQWTRLDFTKNY